MCRRGKLGDLLADFLVNVPERGRRFDALADGKREALHRREGELFTTVNETAGWPYVRLSVILLEGPVSITRSAQHDQGQT